MRPKFHVYIIDEESYFEQKKAILAKVQNEDTYEGFDKYDKAEKWIVENGKRQVNYTIIPTYRHP
jgi:hypothetical protein